MNLVATMKLYCGGPGSGRHPEYGSFKSRPMLGDKRRQYESPNGAVITHDWNFRGAGGKIWIHEHDGKGGGSGKVFQGNDREKARAFLKNRYGIKP